MSSIVKKAIQDYARKNNLKVSSDFYGALDKTVKGILDSAATRAKMNKRKTLKGYDL